MSDPTFNHDNITGHVSVDWHGEEPSPVLIDPVALAQMIEERNAMVSELASLRGLANDQQALIENMQTVLTILRLGRRPNKADWASVNLPPLTPDREEDLRSRMKEGGPTIITTIPPELQP